MMEDRGKLLYEEEIQERRAQAELNANHIGIFVSFLFLILTWTVYGYQAWKGLDVSWLMTGLVISLLLTIFILLSIDIFVRAEFTQYMPIKVYERGILMPATPFDKILWRKQGFIHYNNLLTIRLIKSNKPGQKDVLIATTRQRKSYPKKYDRNSKEAVNILDSIRKAFPQARIEISE